MQVVSASSIRPALEPPPVTPSSRVKLFFHSSIMISFKTSQRHWTPMCQVLDIFHSAKTQLSWISILFLLLLFCPIVIVFGFPLWYYCFLLSLFALVWNCKCLFHNTSFPQSWFIVFFIRFPNWILIVLILRSTFTLADRIFASCIISWSSVSLRFQCISPGM